VTEFTDGDGHGHEQGDTDTETAMDVDKVHEQILVQDLGKTQTCMDIFFVPVNVHVNVYFHVCDFDMRISSDNFLDIGMDINIM
jgi:hypothetical protein